MEKLLEWMEIIEDTRQTGKVRHKLKDILVIVIFATLADADDWVEIELFAYRITCETCSLGERDTVPQHDTAGHGNDSAGGTVAVASEVAEIKVIILSMKRGKK